MSGGGRERGEGREGGGRGEKGRREGGKDEGRREGRKGLQAIPLTLSRSFLMMVSASGFTTEASGGRHLAIASWTC